MTCLIPLGQLCFKELNLDALCHIQAESIPEDTNVSVNSFRIMKRMDAVDLSVVSHFCCFYLMGTAISVKLHRQPLPSKDCGGKWQLFVFKNPFQNAFKVLNLS